MLFKLFCMNENTIKTANGKQREGYWDVVKAFLILFVVWGHCIQFLQVPGDVALYSCWESSVCFRAIYLFHMPLFIGISGYFAAGSIQRHGLKTLSRYGCRLMIPAISYALIHIGFFALVMKRTECHPWVELSYLWFLVVTFECVCLYFPSRRHGRWWARLLWLLIPSILQTWVSNAYPLLLPAAHQFAYLWPFFLMGAWLKERGVLSQNFSTWLAPLFLAIIPAAILCPSKVFVYIFHLDFNSVAIFYALLRTFIALVLCAGFLGLCRFVSRLAHYALVSGIAQATLALYVLQTFFFGVCKIVIPRGIPHLNALSALCVAAVIVVVLYYLYVLLRKLPLIPFLLFGERRRG